MFKWCIRGQKWTAWLRRLDIHVTTGVDSSLQKHLLSPACLLVVLQDAWLFPFLFPWLPASLQPFYIKVRYTK